jgi:hypothetical protein
VFAEGYFLAKAELDGIDDSARNERPGERDSDQRGLFDQDG